MQQAGVGPQSWVAGRPYSPAPSSAGDSSDHTLDSRSSSPGAVHRPVPWPQVSSGEAGSYYTVPGCWLLLVEGIAGRSRIHVSCATIEKCRSLGFHLVRLVRRSVVSQHVEVLLGYCPSS